MRRALCLRALLLSAKQASGDAASGSLSRAAACCRSVVGAALQQEGSEHNEGTGFRKKAENLFWGQNFPLFITKGRFMG